jgi:type III secretion protein T
MEVTTNLLPVIAIAFLRPLGVLLIMPTFSSGVLGGALTRNAIVLMIALLVLPTHSHWPALVQSSPDLSHYIWISCSELAIGMIIGFCAAIPFWMLDMAGFLIDTLRGASIASVLNPLLGQQSSPFGILFSQIFTLIFFLCGGCDTLIETICSSYLALPPGTAIRFGEEQLAFIAQQWQLMYVLCLRFSMPALVVILLVDMALGLVNRSAQQLNVFFLSMPIKSAAVLLALILCVGFAFQLPLNESLQLKQRILSHISDGTG